MMDHSSRVQSRCGMLAIPVVLGKRFEPGVARRAAAAAARGGPGRRPRRRRGGSVHSSYAACPPGCASAWTQAVPQAGPRKNSRNAATLKLASPLLQADSEDGERWRRAREDDTGRRGQSPTDSSHTLVLHSRSP
jgi:hypothetical protein